MRKLFVRFIKITLICSILTAIILIIEPFNFMNIKQAERIAQWKKEYQNIEYKMGLVKIHEGEIPSECDSECVKNRIKPYFNIDETNVYKPQDYKYKKLNGQKIPPDTRFHFTNLMLDKSGKLISIKENDSELEDKKDTPFLMFIDMNGYNPPNRIGGDIFILNVHKDSVSPFGEKRKLQKLKQNCSPIGAGTYCAKYYLYSGQM